MDKPEREPHASGATRLPDAGPGTPGASGGHPRPPAARRAIVLRGLPPYDGDPEPAEGPDLIPVRETYQEPEMPRRTGAPGAEESQELPHWPASAVPRPVSPATPESPAPAAVPTPLPPRWDARDETVTLAQPVSSAPAESTEEIRVQRAAAPVPASERHRPWLLSLAVAATVGVLGAAAAVVPMISQGEAGTAESSTAPEPPPGGALPPADVPVTAVSGSPTPSTSGSPSPSASASASPSPSSTAATPTAAPTPVTTTGAAAQRPVAPAAPAPAAGRVNSSGANIAQGRTAGASSQEYLSWSAAAAVDGDMSTRWSSQAADPQWISIDLGEVWQVNTITLYWETAYATAYRVETSRDGTTWTTHFSTTTGGGGTVLVPAGGVAGRYVRMTGTARVTQYGYSLFEIQVR